MSIFASTPPRNTDLAPWRLREVDGSLGAERYYAGGYGCVYSPRPEFDQPRAHEANPILVRLRELLKVGTEIREAVNILIDEEDYEDETRAKYRMHTREVLFKLDANYSDYSEPVVTPKYVTLGDIAKELQVMKDAGMTRESVEYALDKVYWEGTS